jgi:hypothetical protein
MIDNLGYEKANKICACLVLISETKIKCRINFDIFFQVI